MSISAFVPDLFDQRARLLMGNNCIGGHIYIVESRISLALGSPGGSSPNVPTF
jgi:hypothetical protein